MNIYVSDKNLTLDISLELSTLIKCSTSVFYIETELSIYPHPVKIVKFGIKNWCGIYYYRLKMLSYLIPIEIDNAGRPSNYYYT